MDNKRYYLQANWFFCNVKLIKLNKQHSAQDYDPIDIVFKAASCLVNYLLTHFHNSGKAAHESFKEAQSATNPQRSFSRLKASQNHHHFFSVKSRVYISMERIHKKCRLHLTRICFEFSSKE